MDIHIRKAKINDLEGIENLESTLDHRILSYNLLCSALNKETYYNFVAVKGNKIIGYITAELLVDHFDLLAVAVLDEYRGQGIATLLLNELFKNCNNLNIKDIFLEVRCSNTSAIKLYEKTEFEKISVRRNYYSDTNEDAYIYKKMV